MTLTLGTVITAARDRSAWFHRTRVTDAVIARFLSDAQNELIGAAVRRDPQYLAQTANVVLHLSGDDAPGQVGAGTDGGVPGISDGLGGFGTAPGTAGALIEVSIAAADGATAYVTDRVISSATATTVTSLGAGRGVNADQGLVLVIVTGTGIDQRREIISNTADTWTISTGSDGQQWQTVPDTTSLMSVYVPTYGADEAMTAFTAVPSTTTSVGYLVKLSATGVPYIDFTAPLSATMDAGVSLPAMQFPLDGTVWFIDGSNGPLSIVNADRRFSASRSPSVYFVGQQLFLAGSVADWVDVASIALRYTPVAPPFTALTDVFLIPDAARPVLVSLAASFMAMRVSGVPGVSIDPSPHHATATAAQGTFLASVSAGKRGRGLRTREVW